MSPQILVPYPSVQNIVICELEPIIPPASNEFFGKENYNVLTDRRTRMVYADARHYIARAAEEIRRHHNGPGFIPG